ncbi:hypothetical protein GYB22_10170 [bacterium]|nr:hypothetical protein [bacterium]
MELRKNIYDSSCLEVNEQGILQLWSNLFQRHIPIAGLDELDSFVIYTV